MGKAVHVLTIQGDAYRKGRLEGDFILGEKYMMKAANSRVLDTLGKYISTKDIDRTMWVERYFFFDVAAYLKDVETFGVEFPEL